MNTETITPVNPADLLRILSKYRRMIMVGTCLSIALFTAAAFTLPKRYKASFVLTIYSNYFQNPMIRDFMPEIFDGTEMRAQREALVRQAFTPDFIDRLGQRYGLYEDRSPGPLQRFMRYVSKKYGVYLTAKEFKARSEERQSLMARIDVIGLNSNTFQVGFIYSDPEVAFHVAQELHTQVTHALMDARTSTLNAVHDSMQKRLGFLESKLPSLEAMATPPTPATPASPATAAAAPSSPTFDSVDDELADVRSQLRLLTARYTEEHPLVKELRVRENTLSRLATNVTTPPEEKAHTMRFPADAASEIYRELTKKFNYLTISLDSEQSRTPNYFATLQAPLYPANPLWPKKGLFLLWGLGAGLLISFFIAAIREYFDQTALRSPGLAQHLGIPLIGELPMVYWGPALPEALQVRTSFERLLN